MSLAIYVFIQTKTSSFVTCPIRVVCPVIKTAHYYTLYCTKSFHGSGYIIRDPVLALSRFFLSLFEIVNEKTMHIF